MSPALISRLENWKFADAKVLIDLHGAVDTREYELIVALSRAFGNIGWFDGDLAVVIEVALASIGIKDKGFLS